MATTWPPSGRRRVVAGRFRRSLSCQRRLVVRLRTRRALGARRGLSEDRAARHRNVRSRNAGIAPVAIDHFILQGPARFAVRCRKTAGLAPRSDRGRSAGGMRLHRYGTSPAACWRPCSRRPQAGAQILLAGFGQGCDALLLRATGRSPDARREILDVIAGGIADHDYVRFLSNCGLRRHRLGHAGRARQSDGAVRGVAQARRRDEFRGWPLQGVRHGAVPSLARLRESRNAVRSTRRSRTRSRPRTEP